MRFLVITAFILSITLILGCDSEIRVKIEPVPPKLVLYASVSPDEEIRAYITKSWFFEKNEWESDLESAEVKVYVNNQYTGIMQVDDQTDMPKGSYVFPGYRAKVGERIKITVESPGFDQITGETVIPAYTDILYVDTISNRNSDELIYGNEEIVSYMHFRDNGEEKNYYRFLVRKETEYAKDDRLIVTSDYVGLFGNVYLNTLGNLGYSYDTNETSGYDGFYVDCDDPVLNPMGNNPLPDKLGSFYSYGAFPDELINGREYTLKSTISAYNTYSYQSDTLTAIVHYDFILLSVSESYYQYMKAVWLFELSGWDMESLREPATAYSNVENGYGLVSGHQMATKRITMPFAPAEPSWNPFDKEID